MKTINTKQQYLIPEGVTVDIRARDVTVTGPRGTLNRAFKHIKVQISVKTTKVGKKYVVVEQWFSDRRSMACIRTCLSHIKNLIIGVTKGYCYKMRLVYAHFPISATPENNGSEINMRNFLGEKIVRNVKMAPGVVVERGTELKDQIIISGNCLEDVSQSAANIKQICLVRNKDIRKFLDGVYVYSKENIVQD